MRKIFLLLALLFAAPALAVPSAVLPPAPPTPGADALYDLSTCPGVVWGTGRSDAERTANATAVNACLAAANTAGKIGQFPKRALQIKGGATISVNGTSVKAGMLVDAGSRGLMCARGGGTIITQWDADFPVITFGGDPFGTTGLVRAYISDCEVGMGVQGTANSRCFLFGKIYYSYVFNLTCNRYAAGAGILHPSIGLDFIANSTNFEFSNTFVRINIGAGQVNLIRRAINGTGSNWFDVYAGDGSPGDKTTLSSAGVIWQNSFGGVLSQFNIEWINTPVVMLIQNNPALTINSAHIEGVNGTGFNPQVFNVSTSQVTFNGVDIFDWGNTTAGGATGVPRIFYTYAQSQIQASGVDARFNVGGTGTFGVTDIAWLLYDHDPFGTLPSSSPNVRIRGFHTQGATGAFSLDTTLPVATFGNVTDLGSYTYNRNRSTTEGARINVTNAAFTLYGVHQNAYVNYTGAISAARAVTVSEYLAPSGLGANVRRQANDNPVLYRDGTATGAFNVQFARGRDGGLIGTALTAASTGYSLDPQLIQDLNNNDVSPPLADADQTLYWQGFGIRPIAPTATRTLTLSPNYSASIATPAPRGSCVTIPVAVGSAGSVIVGGVTLAPNTSGKFCTSNATGTAVRVQ